MRDTIEGRTHMEAINILNGAHLVWGHELDEWEAIATPLLRRHLLMEALNGELQLDPLMEYWVVIDENRDWWVCEAGDNWALEWGC